MGAAVSTQGRRRPDGTKYSEMEPGDYCRVAVTGNGRPGVAFVTPNGINAAVDDTWTITEEADGTLTVAPSIDCKGEPRWHGFLRHGVWSEA
jgi:uncharacterized protein DUF6527